MNLASLLSTGGSLLSGLGSFGGLFGGGGLSERKQMALQAQYNREVMQNQLQWRAADAEKAGISKHFAMGAPAVSFAPSSNFTSGGIFDRLDSMGQNISRAANAYGDSKQRDVLFNQEVRMNELKIKDAEISLQKSASDLALSRTAATVPIGDTVITDPSRLTSARPGSRHLESAPPAPAVKYFENADGSVTTLPSRDAKNAIEDMLLYEMEHFYRNRIIPYLSPIGDVLLGARSRMRSNADRFRRARRVTGY